MTVDRTLSPADVGDLLGDKSADWVQRRVNSGQHAHLRVGHSMRFTPEQAEAFIRSFSVDPAAGPFSADDADPMRSQTSRSRNRRSTAA